MRTKTLLIPINSGFAARYFLQTDIFQTLQSSGHRLIILVPDPEDEYLDKLRQHDNVVLATYCVDECSEYLNRTYIERWLKSLRLFVLNGRYNIQTVEDIYRIYLEDISKGEVRSNIRLIKDWVFNRLVLSARRYKFLRKIILWIEHTFFSPPIHAAVFETYHPDLLVVFSLGTFDYDQFLMREAYSKRIPVASIILSWDNTTTRGMPGAITNHVVAWTENMKKELVGLNDIPATKIFVGGIAHYDHYYQEDTFLSKEELFERLELNSYKKLLFFVTKSPNGYAWNADIVEMIMEAIHKNKITEQCQLLVRLHPIYYRRINGRYIFQDFLNQFDVLAERHQDLRINRPNFVTEKMDYSMPKEEMNLLASILRNSDVVINMYSTLNLEASIFDIPIVNVCFEGNSYKGPARARYNIAIDEAQTHNQRIIDSGGITMSRNELQLIEGINKLLLEPGIGRDGRERIKKEECGPCPGYAGKNIANYILELLEK